MSLFQVLERFNFEHLCLTVKESRTQRPGGPCADFLRAVARGGRGEWMV